MGPLDGTVAVVTGGSGIVGSGILHAFLTSGALVLAPVRTERAAEAGSPEDELNYRASQYSELSEKKTGRRKLEQNLSWRCSPPVRG